MSRTDYQEHPCERCGACCANFRVSFYWAEAATRGLPASAVEAVTPHLSCMAGTNRAQPHCAALEGKVGQQVSCAVYPQRPSPCREVQPGEDKCNRARAAYGMPPLSAI